MRAAGLGTGDGVIAQDPPLSAGNAAGHAYTEYGVLVDRTSVGLGVLLAETTCDLERAERLASRSLEAWGYPAEVKARRVYVADWTSVRSDEPR